MSFTLKTWSGFSKRINSTKQPTSGSDLTVKLKDGTSITAPTFLCSTVGTGVNYVYSSDWGRYYFVRDAVQVTADQVELHCAVDVLATYKSQVGSYTGFIEYTTASSKVTITDPRNVQTLEVLTKKNDFLWKTGKGLSDSAGCFILSYLSDESNSSGLVKYAAMDWYALSQFSEQLFTSTVLDEVINEFTNMKDSLVSLMWLPLSINDLTGVTTSNLTIGRASLTLPDSSAKILQSRVFEIETGTTLLTLPKPTGWTDAKHTYLAKAPYMTGYLYLPYVGNVDFPMDLIASIPDTTAVKGAIDVFTGDIVYGVFIDGKQVSIHNGNCATHLPVASASYNAFASATSGLLTVGGLGASALGFATGNPALGVKGLATAAGSAAALFRSAQIHTQINGSNSSAIAQKLGTQIHADFILNLPSEEDLLAFQTAHGMPYFEVDTISNLSGYVKCADASISIPGTEGEKTSLNALVNSGFY